MHNSTLLVIGHGPGIGAHIASTFADQYARVACVSRTANGPFQADVTNHEEMTKVLQKVLALGDLGAVVFNPARIKAGKVLEIDHGEILQDFKTTTLALYHVFQVAIPHLIVNSGQFIVTSSALPEQPVPQLLSLSLCKAAQQNLVLSMEQMYRDRVRFMLVKINGPVSQNEKNLNPHSISKRIKDAVAARERAVNRGREIFLELNP